MTGGRIRLKHSKTSGETLGADGLENGEIALQAAEGLLYYKDADGNIQDAAIAGAPADGNTYGRKDGAWVDLASAAALQFRQGTDAERLAMDPVPASGEPIYATDTNRFFIGDGTTTGGRGIVTDSDAYVICQPGDDLLAKYTAAKALTPGGSAKSATNRAALIIYPGYYDIDDGTLTIDTDYVDVLGVGSGPWSPSVIIYSSATNQISFGGTDVKVVGLYASDSSIATAGGSKRIIANCGSATVFYKCNYTYTGSPDNIQGYLVGCYSGPNSGATSGWFGGSGSMSHTQSNVFTGVVDNCLIQNAAFNGCIFQGVMRNCVFTNTAADPFGDGTAMQGRADFCTLSIVTANINAVSVALDQNAGYSSYTSACTISNASPAVVTLNNHALFTGQRITFATTGSLPTGLTADTTYYVKRIDANTFNVSATLNGADIDTSSAGSGTHTVEVPTYRKDGGWYSYCTTLDGEYTTT